MTESLAHIQSEVTHCELCPRLRAYCRQVAQTRRRQWATEEYWGKPVPGWGDAKAELLLVGLAPAAHGGNRTGRIFTGDRSGDFLFAALHRAGLAELPVSLHRGDGQRPRRIYISAAARCAPPANLPTREEFARCRPYLEREMRGLPRLRAMISLGGLAHRQLLLALQALGWIANPASYPFAHGACFALPQGRWLWGCYHPSQQNTFTGRLTPAMVDVIFAQAMEKMRE